VTSLFLREKKGEYHIDRKTVEKLNEIQFIAMGSLSNLPHKYNYRPSKKKG
jgi:hypothetical protein